ncbi:hypothetical protein AKJ65_02855 [candidate division MSBL1 archaeon SCGC-AAA259E19]|uniref:Uncharacterized protein n=1 Tax=candidate division MSBL1 archaeon SCGC-AAA259E19 TaxID=1698264 RepID=A0A133UL95_9EURY|nr:hypothetical protein AKJ65_02855 [candidate division MSBL1 archaeon SCGC-AAA259E19]
MRSGAGLRGNPALPGQTGVVERGVAVPVFPSPDFFTVAGGELFRGFVIGRRTKNGRTSWNLCVGKPSALPGGSGKTNNTCRGRGS